MGDKEDSISPVPGSDSRSFKIEYPDGVVFTLQFFTYRVSGGLDDSRYVFADDEIWSNISDESLKLRVVETLKVSLLLHRILRSEYCCSDHRDPPQS